MGRRPAITAIALLLALVVAVQLLTRAAGCEPYLTQLSMTAYYTVVALGLCLLMGYAGQISLGHAAFFALGGYTSAILTSLPCGAPGASPRTAWFERIGTLVVQQDLYTGDRMLVPAPWVAFPAALLVAGFVAVLIGYPALRLKGHYLAMATLGFGLIVYRLVLGRNITGSPDGISSVPPWRILPGVVLCSKSEYRVANYYFAWGFLTLVLVFLLNVVDSRFGRALRSIHDGENAANAMGVNTAAHKLKAFVLSAVLAAAAGSFLTHYTGGIGPSETGVMKSVRYVALVAAGGMANLWGTLAISSVLTFLSLRDCFGSYDNAVFGGMLIAIVSLTPEGPLLPLKLLVVKAGRGVVALWRR
jgi:branched-chain amino acid transport system permease protein